MQASRQQHVKICCISSVNEALLAIKYGASALGLVGPMPSGPGVISLDLIRSIVQHVPPPITTFYLTSATTSHRILEEYQHVQTNCIQLVDKLEQGAHQALQAALPNVKLVQVIHVIDQSSIEEATSVAPFVDAILLDSGRPDLRELGGTGRVHNWELSRAIREAIDIPLFLAGGLKSTNVRAAIDAVGPFGLDLCSGVRTDGQLDESKLRAFFDEVNLHRKV